MKNQQTVSGRVSAIVASYNHAEYLPARMNSLIEQTYDNLEILVIDDKSPDNSAEVLSSYKNNPRVRLFLETQNRGWVGTSNLGAERATGEFVIFTNCDDACDKTLIEELVVALKNEPKAVFAWSASSMIDEHGKVIGSDRDCRSQDFIRTYGLGGFIEPKDLSQLLFHSCIMPNLSSVLIRKDFFLKVGGFDPQYKVVSDWDLFFKLCSYGGAIYKADHLNYFRQHETTIRQKAKTLNLITEYALLLCGYLNKFRTTNKFILSEHFKIAEVLLGPIFSEQSLLGRLNLLQKTILIVKNPAISIALIIAIFGRIINKLFK